MTRYDPHVQRKQEDPYEVLEIGVNIISKHHDIVDVGDGHVGYIPTIDKLIFLKIERRNYNLEFIKQELRKRGYGSSFTIRSYWIAETDIPY